MKLKKCLISEHSRRKSVDRECVGGLWGMIEVSTWRTRPDDATSRLADLARRLSSQDQTECISASFAIMQAAYEQFPAPLQHHADRLVQMLPFEKAERHATAWALVWLNGGWLQSQPPRASIWSPTPAEIDLLRQTLRCAGAGESDTAACLIHILARMRSGEDIKLILEKLEQADETIRHAVVHALRHTQDKQGVPALISFLDDSSVPIRILALDALKLIGDDRAVPALIAKLGEPDPALRNAELAALQACASKRIAPDLIAMLAGGDTTIRVAVIEVLGRLKDPAALASLKALLEDSDFTIRAAAGEAAAAIGDSSGVDTRSRLLGSENVQIRQLAVHYYALYRDAVDRQLLSRNGNGAPPWIDPHVSIPVGQVGQASAVLNLDSAEIQSRYEALANDLGLKLEWKD